MAEPVQSVKVVGTRTGNQPATPAAYHQRAMALARRVDRLNPYPKPRGFVFKARTWDEYERWRAAQTNPRLW